MFVNVGVCLLRLTRLKEARLALNRAKQLLPANEASLLDNLRALKELEDYHRKYPPSEADAATSSSSSSRRSSDKSNGPGDPTLATKLTNEAIALAESGNLHNAFGLFEQAALADPTDGKLWENLGKQIYCSYSGIIIWHCGCWPSLQNLASISILHWRLRCDPNAHGQSRCRQGVVREGSQTVSGQAA